MHKFFKALMGFAVGWLVAAVCGFGAFFGPLGLIIPAVLMAVVFAKQQVNLTAMTVKTTPGYWLLAFGRFVGGAAAGLFLAMLAGTVMVKWLNPGCAGIHCEIPPAFGFVGLIGGGIIGLLYFRRKIARTLPAKPVV